LSKAKHLTHSKPEWQQRFETHVTSTAFHITLSKRMVDLLDIVRHADAWPQQNLQGLSYHHTALRLVDRGLIRYRCDKSDIRQSRYVLTPAGEHMVQLLILSGLMPREFTILSQGAA